MNIRPAEPDDKQRWDDFVSARSEASPYHLFAWKIALEKSYGHKCIYLLAHDGNKVVGILPLVQINTPFRKSCLVSLPFCDIGGPLAESPDISQKLIQYGLHKGRELNVSTLELRLSRDATLMQDSGVPASVSSHKVRMLLELPGSSENLWNSFKSKLRSQVRKAEKNNLVFQWGSIDDVKDFYRVFSKNMRDLGSPVHSLDWLSSVIHSYGPNGRLGLVRLDNQVIGGGIILAHNKKVCVPWASTLREYNRLGPNMLIYWNFLKFAADEGYVIFDFGRSTPEETTFKFKAQWGAEPAPLFWYTYYIDGSKASAKAGESSVRSAAESIWKKLPLPVANYFGPKIRKYISL